MCSLENCNKNNKFYITTPLYYPSDNLHIGHAYTTVIVDAIARYKKEKGFDVRFLTGTDEHGQKIERKAKDANLQPIEYVDGIIKNIKELWEILDISYDDFIRTSDENHVQTVQNIFKKLYDKGYIYKGEYEGWYCTPDEAFFTNTQLVDGKCPVCGRDVEKTKEEAYFLRLSDFQEWLMKYLDEHPDFVEPISRKNEIVKNFLEPGLEDLCVSRTSVKWGIPVSFDEKHTVYVWLDALSGYISSLGYLNSKEQNFDRYWPADLQIVGKEIIRFHLIIWPIILHMLGEEMPKKIFAHGWLVLNGQKISKSMGNTIDPVALSNKFGSDAIRYYVLRAVPFGSDGQFTYESLITLINSDLANTLGNLLSRSISMIQKYFDSNIIANKNFNSVDKDLINKAINLPALVDKSMDAIQVPQAITDIFDFVSACNKYIDITEPWVLGKDESSKERLQTVLYVLAESLRFIAVMLRPFIPKSSKKIIEQLGISDQSILNIDSLKEFGKIENNTRVNKTENIFPRIDIKAELADLVDDNKQEIEKPKPKSEKAAKTSKQEISIDEFDKSEMCVAEVLDAEKLENTDKLLKLKVDIGQEQRTIVSGIAKFYNPQDLIGKKVVIVKNLKAIKLRGIESHGMLLTASYKKDGKEYLQVLEVSSDMQNGASIG